MKLTIEHLEDNKLIAEFMGLQINDNNMVVGYLKSNKCRQNPDGQFLQECKYHSSWDWLMPVVEKIETTIYSFPLNLNEITIKRNLTSSIVAPFDFYYHDTKEWVFKLELERTALVFGGERFKTKIEAVYSVIVKFIEWYNTQPTTNK